MTLARLLLATLLLSFLSGFAQAQANGGPIIFPFRRPCVVPEVPWRIFPDQPADLGSGQNPFFRFDADGRHFGYVYCVQDSGHTEDTVGNRSYVAAHFEDMVCYTMRNYLVARDSQDSDSVHPAGYSTCQPASCYGVKTIRIRPDSAGR